MSWGKGGLVGVRKAIWRHEQTIKRAEVILAEEHGTRHKEGEHELCPKCRDFKARTNAPNIVLADKKSVLTDNEKQV
jgi:hypothetical protein